MTNHDGDIFLNLPVDVVDAIFEFLRENSDLKSCSLVCQTWHLSSRRLLYRSVTLKSPTACANLYTLVCSTPPIAPLIRELHVPMLPARRVTSEASLPPLLDALPRLRALFFAYQDWVRYSLAFKQALCRAVCKPREGHGMGMLSLSTHPLHWEITPAHTDVPQLKSLHFKVEQRDMLTLLSSVLGGIEYLHLDALLLQYEAHLLRLNALTGLRHLRIECVRVTNPALDSNGSIAWLAVLLRSLWCLPLLVRIELEFDFRLGDDVEDDEWQWAHWQEAARALDDAPLPCLAEVVIELMNDYTGSPSGLDEVFVQLPGWFPKLMARGIISFPGC